jgi:polyhydroxyalkanoate synthesis regulator phasin
MTFTPKQCAEELAYELQMRNKFYPRLVRDGDMTEEGARRRRDIIKQMLDEYEQRAAAEEKKESGDIIEELDLFG